MITDYTPFLYRINKKLKMKLISSISKADIHHFAAMYKYAISIYLIQIETKELYICNRTTE